jgi:hypothetical protein
MQSNFTVGTNGGIDAREWWPRSDLSNAPLSRIMSCLLALLKMRRENLTDAE